MSGVASEYSSRLAVANTERVRVGGVFRRVTPATAAVLANVRKPLRTPASLKDCCQHPFPSCQKDKSKLREINCFQRSSFAETKGISAKLFASVLENFGWEIKIPPESLKARGKLVR